MMQETNIKTEPVADEQNGFEETKTSQPFVQSVKEELLSTSEYLSTEEIRNEASMYMEYETNVITESLKNDEQVKLEANCGSDYEEEFESRLADVEFVDVKNIKCEEVSEGNKHLHTCIQAAEDINLLQQFVQPLVKHTENEEDEYLSNKQIQDEVSVSIMQEINIKTEQVATPSGSGTGGDVVVSDVKSEQMEGSNIEALQRYELHTAIDIKEEIQDEAGATVTQDTCVNSKPVMDDEQTVLEATPSGSNINEDLILTSPSLDATKSSGKERQNRKTHECQHCDKFFTNKWMFKKHIKVHIEEKPYKCGTCGMGFSRLFNLQTHQVVHTGERKYKCELCNKTFKFPIALKTHTYSHTGEKPYKCIVCCKAFTHTSHLKQHQVVHTGVRKHKCNICGKAFTQSSSLKKHQMLHTGERNYICNVCRKAFASARNLSRHQLVHTKEVLNSTENALFTEQL